MPSREFLCPNDIIWPWHVQQRVPVSECEYTFVAKKEKEKMRERETHFCKVHDTAGSWLDAYRKELMTQKCITR